MTIKTMIGVVLLAAAVTSGANARAADYKLERQTEACYEHLYYWQAQELDRYTISRNECNRYGVLILQDNMDGDKADWLDAHVWLVKRANWLEKRKALGQFVPRMSVTTYLAMMLEDEGIDLLRDQEIVGRSLGYVDTSFTPTDVASR